MERVPVSLFTGFLGSGKTTLLRGLLRSPALADTAVVVNEFGEVGLDHVLLERGREDVVLLDSGCLCCEVSSELGETLADLHFRRRRGEVPDFRRVVIETSGLADPGPILALLVGDPSVARWFVLDRVVTCVDVIHGERQLEEHPEARHQAAVADVLVVTKIDVASAGQLERLEARLASINPRALRVAAANGRVDASRVLPAGSERASSAALAFAPSGDGVHDAHRAPHEHRNDVTSFALNFERPVGWPQYAAWLAQLRTLPAADLLRTKGIIALGEDARPHVIQGVQHVFATPVPLDAWPAGYGAGALVFITRGIPRSEIESRLRAEG
jgi:G3E family GTPase